MPERWRQRRNLSSFSYSQVGDKKDSKGKKMLNSRQHYYHHQHHQFIEIERNSFIFLCVRQRNSAARHKAT